MNWEPVFNWKQKESGASKAVLNRFVSEVGRPLSAAEVRRVNRSQQNPFPPSDPLHAMYRPFDPSAWVVPNCPMPESYLSFLGWSNGGQFGNGDRWFQMFSTRGVREMLLAYALPQYMPGGMPFAFNGGGVFYLFDMRHPSVKGEYPIVAASAGYLNWEAAGAWRRVATTFIEACSGTTTIEDLWE